eukprot:8583501-Ditylum_brightwellii.AAC.1
MRGPGVSRRRLSKDHDSTSLEEDEEIEMQQEEERRRLDLLLKEEGGDLGSWLGVLSSTNIQYFVRIMPSSAVGVVHLDDYAY